MKKILVLLALLLAFTCWGAGPLQTHESQGDIPKKTGIRSLLGWGIQSLLAPDNLALTILTPANLDPRGGGFNSLEQYGIGSAVPPSPGARVSIRPSHLNHLHRSTRLYHRLSRRKRRARIETDRGIRDSPAAKGTQPGQKSTLAPHGRMIEIMGRDSKPVQNPSRTVQLTCFQQVCPVAGRFNVSRLKRGARSAND